VGSLRYLLVSLNKTCYLFLSQPGGVVPGQEDPVDEWVQIPLRVRPDKKAKLDLLHERTRVPRAVLLREALDDLLHKYDLLSGGE